MDEKKGALSRESLRKYSPQKGSPAGGWCERTEASQTSTGSFGRHGGYVAPPTGLDSTVDARRDSGQDGPGPHRTQRTMHRLQPSYATFPTPPTPQRPGKTTTPQLLNPTLRSYCQHPLRNVHCVNCRTLWQPSLPDQARSWSTARARRTRFKEKQAKRVSEHDCSPLKDTSAPEPW